MGRKGGGTSPTIVLINSKIKSQQKCNCKRGVVKRSTQKVICYDWDNYSIRVTALLKYIKLLGEPEWAPVWSVEVVRMSHARKFPAQNWKTPHWLVEIVCTFRTHKKVRKKAESPTLVVEMVHTLHAQRSPKVTGKPHIGSRNGLYVTYTKSPEEIGKTPQFILKSLA